MSKHTDEDIGCCFTLGVLLVFAAVWSLWGLDIAALVAGGIFIVLALIAAIGE